RDRPAAPTVRLPGAARPRASRRHRAAARRGVGQRRGARGADRQADSLAGGSDVCAGPVRRRADVSARKGIVGRIVRGLLAAAGVVVILLAVAIGALRIAAMQLPSYQAQIDRKSTRLNS